MTLERPVVLDACVLVGAGLRDTLLRLAESPVLYSPRWTDDILREVELALQNRFGKTPQQTRYLSAQLRQSFPEAWVRDYCDLIPALSNHEKDRHVLAAAVRCNAQSIVTFNTRHFRPEALGAFDIDIFHPDQFLINQLCLHESTVLARFSDQASNIGRTTEEQARAFHQTGALPLFSQAIATAFNLHLD